jgi:hypothetical protein
MKYAITAFTLLLSTLVLPACFRDATVTGLPVADEPALEDWRNHFLYGVVRGIKTDDVELDEVCPQGAARMETKQNGWNGLVSVLTLGIYTPQKLNVYCAAKTPSMEMSERLPAAGAEAGVEETTPP